MKIGLLTSAALVLSATAVSAGGLATVPDPVVVEPVTAIPVAAPGNWQGAYGGVSLGYAFNGDDDFGLDENDDTPVPPLGTLELKGVNGGLHLGYRWQRDRLVIGPELSVTAGNIEDSFTVDGTEIESKVNHVAALKLKTGYEVQPNMLVFGTAGVARGDFTYSVGDTEFDYKSNGYVFGLGVERMLTERMSVTGEIEHNKFDSEEVDLGGGVVSNATPSFTNVKVGLNFRF